ncbi:MAG: peptidoglycan DD-metalloendopeptidase family protein [Vicingus serpentipes]|nr:peptidoglycan DD-metalloendopeptidase family protein [Vicingus serpentipes]
MKITIILILLTSWKTTYANKEETKKSEKDTVSALVIAPSNPLYESISDLSGNEIMDIIDSLLNLDKIPLGLIEEINEYAQDNHENDDSYIALTNYYDDSEIPSNSMYQLWDTKNVSPYNDSITKNDSTLLLTLVDTANFCNYVAPLQNPVVTSNFGWRDGRAHSGIDLDLEVWDPVVAAFDGMVRVALYHPGYGRVVVIRHHNGLETLYAHLHRFKVKTGDIVSAGQVIGLGGSSGRSSGSHLHFEVRFKGKCINPKHIISFKQNKLISDSLILTKKKWDYAALPVGVKYHKIVRGDYMYKIANRYNVSVKELCEMNGLRRNSLLIVGRTLRIN